MFSSLLRRVKLVESIQLNPPSFFSFRLLAEDMPEANKEDIDFINAQLAECGEVIALNLNRWDERLLKLSGNVIQKLEELITVAASEVLVVPLSFIAAYLSYRLDADREWLYMLNAALKEADLTHPSLYWYKAVIRSLLLTYTKGYNSVDLYEMLEAREHLAEPHRSGVVKIVLAMMSRCNAGDYLSSELVSLLKLAEAELFAAEPRVILSGIEMHARRQVVDFYLSNSKYARLFDVFDFAKLSGLDSKAPRNIRIPAAATTSPYIQCNERELVKFVAHLHSIGFPTFKVKISVFNPMQLEAFNKYLKIELEKAGYVNSEGMLVKANVFNKDQHGKVLNPSFVEKVKAILMSYDDPKLEELTDTHLQEMVEDFIKNYQMAMQTRQRLAFFDPINALFLVHQAIKATPVPPEIPVSITEAQLKMAEDLVKNCLKMAAMAKDIIKTKHLLALSEHEKLFDRVGKIVDRLWASPKDHIVQSVYNIVKIPPSGVASDTDTAILHSAASHAFYVLLKYRAEVEGGAWQIYIFNGGPGLSIHRRLESLHESEFADKEYGVYHAVSSVVLPMTDANKQFFKNYLYKVLALAYSPHGGDRDYAQSMMRNLYLGDADGASFSFQGYGAYRRTEVFRQCEMVPYRAQLTENCTVHNLLLALGFSLGLNDGQFEELKDVLLWGAEAMISSAMDAAPSTMTLPVSASAVSGMLEDEAESGSLFYADDAEVASVYATSSVTLAAKAQYRGAADRCAYPVME